MIDLTKEGSVVFCMSASTSEEDWNERCDMVKGQNEGRCPDFWYAAIILGGVLNKARQAW